MSSSYRVAGGVVFVGLAVTAFGNAVGAETYCRGHHQSWSCDNPAAPLPQLPDEITNFTPGSSVTAIAIGMSAFVIGPSSGS